jgi:hypothetical protein
MIQTYSLILWSKAKKEDLDTSIDKAYRMLLAINECGPQFGPNFLTGKTPRLAKPFELNYANVEKLVKKEANKLFPDLGSEFSFFSSKQNHEGAGISISIGISDPKFTNSLVLELPINFQINDDKNIEMLLGLFRKGIDILDPYLGFILNSFTHNRVDDLAQNHIPTTVHWMNFWSNEIVQHFGEKRLLDTPMYMKEKIINKGYIFMIQRKPLDDNHAEEVELQFDTNRSLGIM